MKFSIGVLYKSCTLSGNFVKSGLLIIRPVIYVFRV